MTSVRSVFGQPETAQFAELHSDLLTVLTAFNVPIAVVVPWQVWRDIEKRLEAK